MLSCAGIIVAEVISWLLHSAAQFRLEQQGRENACRGGVGRHSASINHTDCIHSIASGMLAQVQHDFSAALLLCLCGRKESQQQCHGEQ